MRYIYKEAYLRAFVRLPPSLQELVQGADQQLKDYYETGRAPYGLRLTQLVPKVFEARATRAVRIVWKVEGDLVTFVLVGNHDEVSRFLRRL